MLVSIGLLQYLKIDVMKKNGKVKICFIPDSFQYVVSSLKVSRLDMYGEKYKPFKGVKYVTKAGRFQVRMWRKKEMLLMILRGENV